MNREDYYQTLGLERKASAKEIREAYRRLAFQYHPDKNRDNPASVERMKAINEAYAVLSDPKKKGEYDTYSNRYGTSGYDRFRQAYSEDDIFRGSDINQVFEEMARAFGFRGFEEVFKESYGEGYRSFEFRRPGVFGRGFVYFGPGYRRTGRLFRQTGPAPSSGNQLGVFGKFTQYLLKRMLGLEATEKGKDLCEVIALDPRVARDGGKIRYLHQRRRKELIIRIPPQMADGQKVRLKGMGQSGKGGGEPGDLYLKVQIRKPLIERIRGLLGI